VSNTQGHNIGQGGGAPAANDPYGVESRYRPGETTSSAPPPAAPPVSKKILPQNTFLDIATANYQTISKKILETNKTLIDKGEKGSSLNPDDVNSLNLLVKFLEKPSAPTSASAKSSQAVVGGLSIIIKIITEWQSSRLPGLDLLRLLARYSPAVPLFGEESDNIINVLEVGGGFDKETPNNVMLSARAFLNMFHTPDGLIFVDKRYEEVSFSVTLSN